VQDWLDGPRIPSGACLDREEIVMRVEVDAVMKVAEIPADREALAEQAVAECPRAALVRKD